MKYDYLSFRREVTRTVRCIALLALAAGAATSPASAEDWGAYAVIPASAPTLVLEAVGSGTTEGTVISIGKPAGTPNQKWVITAKGNNLYSDQAVCTPGPGARRGERGTAIGDGHRARNGERQALAGMDPQEKRERIVLPHSPARSRKRAWIIWAAGQSPEQRSTCGQTTPGDPHLEWIIKPLAGTMAAVAPRYRRISAQHLRSARNQTRRHSQRRTEEFHLFEQHDFSGDRSASDGLHSRPSTMAPNRLASTSGPTALTRSNKLCSRR